MANSMKVTFDKDSVRDYEFTHGRKPRGAGYWSFTLHRNGSALQTYHLGTLSEARRAAMQEARELGCDTVTLDT